MKTGTTFEVTLADIQTAKQLLDAYLDPSPLLRNAWLSEQFGCDLYLKLENMQPIGSFKIRGATFKISQLSKNERKRGVIAASAGNHAQGVAWGARLLGVNAVIVMPRGAPLVKIQNTKALGAKILLEGDNFSEAMQAAKRIAKQSNRVFIHGFEDPDVIAGQGTVGLEILEQLPDVDMIVGSVGGGGLMAGVALAFKAIKPKTWLVGCQSAGVPSMIQSVRKGRAVNLNNADTFADGIAIPHASEKVRQLLQPRIDQWLTEDDETIAGAVLTLLEKAKIITEGAGALPLAALEQLRKRVRNKKVVLIISGGNIDVNLLGRIIDRGLIRSGRRVRVNVLLSDRPGSLAALTDLIARQGASVLQAIHDRSEPSTTIDQTDVALTLETRGPEHSKAIIQALTKHVIRLDVMH